MHREKIWENGSRVNYFEVEAADFEGTATVPRRIWSTCGLMVVAQRDVRTSFLNGLGQSK